MNTLEKTKDIFAKILNYTGIMFLIEKIRDLVYPKSYLRIVNYHFTLAEYKNNFDKQMEYFSKHYYFFDMKDYDKFFNKELKMDKPYLLITFDDGCKDNYEVAFSILKKHNAKACFFIVADDVNTSDNKMNSDMIKDLIKNGHTIGSHTCTHHRFDEENDSDEVNRYEIIESKKKLEEMFNINVDDFCWCGGETCTYSSNAEKYIEQNYKHSFLTNGGIVRNREDYNLNRINLEINWSIPLIRLQLCGLMDLFYIKKKKLIANRLDNIK